MIGIWLGVRGAWERGGKFDNISTGTSLTLYAMPEWWLGLMLIAVFAVGIGPIPGFFPTGGLHSVDADPSSVMGVLDTVRHLTLPVVTLTLAYLADYALIMRSSLLDELGEDYLTTARAKGLRDVQVRNRHAVRNALLPTTTVVALNLGLRGDRRDHHRDGLLDPGPRACWRPRRCRCPTSGCSRAPSWSPRSASSSPTWRPTWSTASSTPGCGHELPMRRPRAAHLARAPSPGGAAARPGGAAGARSAATGPA